MTWAALIRILSIVCLIALFVSDYGFAVWAKEIDTKIYLGLLAIALGVDAAWLRDIAKAVLMRWAGMDRSAAGSVNEDRGADR